MKWNGNENINGLNPYISNDFVGFQRVNQRQIGEESLIENTVVSI